MQFSAKEMEIVCVFYAETRLKTIHRLQEAMPCFVAQTRITDAENALRKLGAMQSGEQAILAFDDE